MNGTAATARSRTQAGAGQQRDLRKDAFVPENVYGAMKENKRFDSMRVSSLFICIWAEI